MKTKTRSTQRFKKMDVNRCRAKNKSTRNLPGERWKPVPDLEDTHEVSSYGRFRSLDRIIYPENVAPYFRKGHIMSPHVSCVPNYHSKDFTYHVAINVQTKNGNISFSIRRLVYHCFIEPIELHDGVSPKYLIVPKDGNGLNTYYKNLVKVTKSELELTIYKRNRIPNTLKSLSRRQRLKMAQKGKHKRYKAVSQYDKTGNKIAFYPSLREAAMRCNVRLSSIGNAIKGRILTAGGFVWRYGDGPDRINLEVLSQRMDDYLSKVSQPVTQYDLNGKRVAVYSSIREACRITGFNHSTLSACLNGRIKIACDFVWQRGIGAKKIKVTVKSFRIKIAQYSHKGKELRTFPSVFAAATATGLPYHQIRTAMDNNQPLAGYLWRKK